MATRDAYAIARPYAEAAFAVAKESKRLKAWREQLAFVDHLVHQEWFLRLYRSPEVDREFLEGLIFETGREILDEGGRNFVRLLLENGRLEVVPQIYELYEKLRRQYEQQVEVEVTSARPLTKREQQQIASALKKRLGRKVQPIFQEDPELIGGLVIRYGDRVIDGSVRGRLEELKRQLLRSAHP